MEYREAWKSEREKEKKKWRLISMLRKKTTVTEKGGRMKGECVCEREGYSMQEDAKERK